MASSSLPSLSSHFSIPHYSKILAFPFRPARCSFLPSTTFFCLATSSNPSDSHREEALWLREEQRWLREEQRWLREEQRWIRDRESLLGAIADLKFQIQSLEKRNSAPGAEVTDTMANIGALLQVLKEKSRIAESGSSATPFALEEKRQDGEEEEKHFILEEKRQYGEEEEKHVVLEKKIVQSEKEKKMKKERRTLRVGSEGEEVQEMQEALQTLGFYSGEEDIEFSSFSSGTASAVKTWQASVGVPEDGVMTAELLEKLYIEQTINGVSPNGNVEKIEESVNGTVVSSVAQISDLEQTAMKEDEIPHHRVFLLGENRWEDPSRMAGRNNQGVGNKSMGSAVKCLTCRGEGRLMCIECDGTGEPNVEEQFLEWVAEGAKCPYCNGLGYTICDLCEGKANV